MPSLYLLVLVPPMLKPEGKKKRKDDLERKRSVPERNSKD